MLLMPAGTLLAEAGPLPATTIAFNMQNAQWQQAAEPAVKLSRPQSRSAGAGEAAAHAAWLLPALQLLCDYLVDDSVEVRRARGGVTQAAWLDIAGRAPGCCLPPICWAAAGLCGHSMSGALGSLRHRLHAAWLRTWLGLCPAMAGRVRWACMPACLPVARKTDSQPLTRIGSGAGHSSHAACPEADTGQPGGSRLGAQPERGHPGAAERLHRHRWRGASSSTASADIPRSLCGYGGAAAWCSTRPQRRSMHKMPHPCSSLAWHSVRCARSAATVPCAARLAPPAKAGACAGRAAWLAQRSRPSTSG